MPAIIVRRAVVLLSVLALSTVFTSCSDSSGPEPITGTYTLRTVNALALPYLVVSETSGGVTSKFEVTDGNAVLNADNSFTSSVTLRQTVGSTATSTVSSTTGTYTISGSALTFRGSDGLVTPATLVSGTITVATGGLALALSK